MDKISELFKNKKKRDELYLFANKGLLYVVCFFMVLASLNYHTNMGSKFVEGEISTRTIYAPIDFSFPIEVNEELTQNKLDEEIKKVLPVYDVDADLTTGRFKRFYEIFQSISQIVDVDTQIGHNKINVILKEETFSLTKRDIAFLASTHLMKDVASFYLNNLKQFVDRPLIGKVLKESLADNEVSFIEIIDANRGSENYRIDDLPVVEEVRDEYMRHFRKKFPNDSKLHRIIEKTVNLFVLENIVENNNLYAAHIQEVRSRLDPIYEMGIVRKNELIIEKGTMIDGIAIKKLRALYPERFSRDFIKKVGGQALILLLLLVILFSFLRLFGVYGVDSGKNIFVAAMLLSLLMLAFKACSYHQITISIVPISAFCMIIALLIGVRVAFMTLLVAMALTGLIEGVSTILIFSLFTGSCASLFYVKSARKRMQIFISGLIAGLTNCVVYVVISGVYFFGPEEFNKNEMLVLLFNGILSSSIVFGFLPLLEAIFKYCTNITLLELSDLNNPLLKELTLKAPGTYHHSLVVGNLAEAACDAIQANSLLARVGSYYHDIGKTVKPQYFTENEMGARSKHQELSPSMSALIVTNHVKDGITIAKKNKLPQAVIDFIPGHHGTSLIYYFYQKAQTKSEDDERLSELGFRYTGPKPQTKETAIVMLADSVEASSRTLKDPTPAHLSAHIDKIFNMKFTDGQLSECDLTLKDLDQIAKSFVRILAWSFHTRIEYPGLNDESSNKKGSENGSEKPKEKKSDTDQ